MAFIVSRTAKRAALSPSVFVWSRVGCSFGTDDEGNTTYALTREGKAIGRQLAMTQGDDARLDIINELLDATEPDT